MQVELGQYGCVVSVNAIPPAILSAIPSVFGGDIPWWRSTYAAIATDGSTVYPTWLFDGLNQRYAKASSPTGSVSQVAFSGLLEGFARASDATYFDASGTLRTAATNDPRFTYEPATGQPLGLLVEESRTNFLLNSNTPATQIVSLATGTYTLWVVGSGSCTPSVGTAVGSGFAAATASAPNTFTITTAGTVSFTVSGSLTRFQCENGATATSYIPAAGSTVTRAADIPETSSLGWLAEQKGSLVIYFRGADLASSVAKTIFSFGDGTANNQIYVKTSGSNRLRAVVSRAGVGAAVTGTALISAGLNKMVVTWTPTQTLVYLNGSLDITINTATPSIISQYKLRLNPGNAEPADQLFVPTNFYYAATLAASEAQRLSTL